MATTNTAPAAMRDRLNQTEAAQRAERVSGVQYDLSIELRAGASSYRGELGCRFDLEGDGELFLDFRGGRIVQLEVNGQSLEPAWDGCRVLLPAGSLAPRNVLRIAWENPYDHTGVGLHQFLDPEDGGEYLYTHFEPFGAHRLFPCFDQPDLKAEIRLAVTAPAGWEVVGNSLAVSTEPLPDRRIQHRFAPTPPISTYLVALVAGPYHVVRAQHGDIPMAIYCRRALARHLDPDEIFTVTRQGIDFYAELFDRPFPFDKYDHCFVPEFNAGAMENVGTITVHESGIFQDPPTEHDRLGRADLILHELAHMWFGDLVTMRWWNDLWLNESFATYMSYLALHEATRFRDGWKEFLHWKRSAYRQDQLVTTHPISCVVPDTDATQLNFDQITYGKGAAVIKQLVAAIGMPGFRDGMRRYFRRHAFGNSTLADFLAALEEGSGQELGTWSSCWIEQASLNTLAASWEVADGRLASLRLRQLGSPTHPLLRPHAVEIALVERTTAGLQTDAITARIDDAEAEVPIGSGRPAPVFVFPNHNDHTFAKVELDPVSLAFAREGVDQLEDPLLRELVWLALWEMVRDRRLRSTEYLSMVRQQLARETDLELLDGVLATAVACLARYVPEVQRHAEARAFGAAALQALRNGTPGDRQVIWARAAVEAASGPEELQALMRLADGEDRIEGLTVDQELRWSIAVKAVAYGLPEAAQRVEDERARDSSERGRRALLRAQAARPDQQSKRETWERIHGEGFGSLYLTAAAMTGFGWADQHALLAPYAEEFFDRVEGVFATQDHEFAASYFARLFPGYLVEPSTLARTERLLERLDRAQPRLRRMLLEAQDELARAVACRDYATP